jgi:hypothetical protein
MAFERRVALTAVETSNFQRLLTYRATPDHRIHRFPPLLSFIVAIDAQILPQHLKFVNTDLNIINIEPNNIKE